MAFLYQISLNFFYLKTKLTFKDDYCSEKPNKGITIIVCVHNEAKNLKKNLASLLHQENVIYELIVVDDHSTDDSFKVLKEFENKYPIFKFVCLNSSKKSKRAALTAGVKAAQYEYILVTDADCQPNSNNWAYLFSRKINKKQQMILGVSPYYAEKNYANKLTQFETFQTAVQFLSFAKNNMAYMGLGRNMAFTKELFFKYSQYELDHNLKSGDDDMFVQRVPQQFIGILTTQNSLTFSHAKKSLKSWWRQKRRHYTTAPSYKLKDKIILSLNGLSLLIFWILSLILIPFQNEIIIFIILYVTLKTLVIFKHKQLGNLKEIKWYWPLLDLNLVIFQTLILIQNLFQKPKFWS